MSEPGQTGQVEVICAAESPANANAWWLSAYARSNRVPRTTPRKTVEWALSPRKRLMKMIAKEISKTGLGKTLKKRLGKSRRNRAEVNIGKINKNTKQGETIVVPGKVLAEGALDHAVTVAAMSFSKNAVQKIEKAGGKAVALDAFKSAKNVRVMA